MITIHDSNDDAIEYIICFNDTTLLVVNKNQKVIEDPYNIAQHFDILDTKHNRYLRRGMVTLFAFQQGWIPIQEFKNVDIHFLDNSDETYYLYIQDVMSFHIDTTKLFVMTNISENNLEYPITFSEKKDFYQEDNQLNQYDLDILYILLTQWYLLLHKKNIDKPLIINHAPYHNVNMTALLDPDFKFLHQNLLSIETTPSLIDAIQDWNLNNNTSIQHESTLMI